MPDRCGLYSLVLSFERSQPNVRLHSIHTPQHNNLCNNRIWRHLQAQMIANVIVHAIFDRRPEKSWGKLSYLHCTVVNNTLVTAVLLSSPSTRCHQHVCQSFPHTWPTCARLITSGKRSLSTQIHRSSIYALEIVHRNCNKCYNAETEPLLLRLPATSGHHNCESTGFREWKEEIRTALERIGAYSAGHRFANNSRKLAVLSHIETDQKWFAGLCWSAICSPSSSSL